MSGAFAQPRGKIDPDWREASQERSAHGIRFHREDDGRFIRSRMAATARKLVAEPVGPLGRPVIDGVNARPGFVRNRAAGRVDRIEMRGFEMRVDDDDIRTADAVQSTQHPFEIGAKRIGRNRRRAGERMANERHAIPDRRRNPRIDPYRSESISRALRGCLGNNDIGIEPKMRSMRFDGSDWQQDDRVRVDQFSNLGPAQ